MDMAIRKLIPVILFLTCLTGCAWIGGLKADYERCYSDPVCHSNMLLKAKMAGEIGQTAGGASGIPMAGQIAGAVFSGIALLVSGIAGGAALRKKQDPVIPNNLADKILKAVKNG